MITIILQECSLANKLYKYCYMEYFPTLSLPENILNNRFLRLIKNDGNPVEREFIGLIVKLMLAMACSYDKMLPHNQFKAINMTFLNVKLGIKVAIENQYEPTPAHLCLCAGHGAVCQSH